MPELAAFIPHDLLRTLDLTMPFDRRFPFAGLVLLSALLSACAGTTTRLPPISPQAVEAEQEKQRELVLAENERRQGRLDSIAYPILAAATPLCPTARGPILGLRLATVHHYDEVFQPAATRVLGVSDTLTIIGVTPGAPASWAGLRPGDLILAANGSAIPAGSKATTAFDEAMSAARSQAALRIRYSRDGVERSTEVPLVPACAFGTVLVNTGELNAYADGERIYMTSTMMRFANDEELGVVVAHELAHNAMEHIKAKKKNALFGGLLGVIADVFLATRGVNTGGYYTSRYASLGAEAFSQDFEREADYVGLYAMALVGAPLESAPRFWRHMAQEDPKSIQLAFTHPTTAERFVRMEHSIREIEGKRSRRLALMPELKSAQQRSGAEMSPASVMAGSSPTRQPAALGLAPRSPKLQSSPAERSGVSSAPSAEGVPEQGYMVSEESEWTRVLASSPELREVADDIERLEILDDVREIGPGALSAMVGPEFDRSSSEFYITQLLSAYRQVMKLESSVTLDLWDGPDKLHGFVHDGITLFSASGN